MMEVCYNNHSEIAYSAKHCPLCEAIRNIVEIIKWKDMIQEGSEELEKERKILQDEVKELQDTINRMGVEE